MRRSLIESGIQFWEVLLAMVVLAVILVIANIIKNRKIDAKPEYRFFVWGLLTKVAGGIVFFLIYFFYYRGGDTIAYFESAETFVNLLLNSIGDFSSVYFSSSSRENVFLFNGDTGFPHYYMYSQLDTFTVIRLIIPIVFLTGKSYLLTTIIVSCLSYYAAWQAYRVFCDYYRDKGVDLQLAIAFLFVPSAVFWGSGILKDSITMAAASLFFCGFYGLFIANRRILYNIFFLLIWGYLLIAIKPYILLALMPGALVWLVFDRIKGIQNKILSTVLVPFLLILAAGVGGALLSFLGDSLSDYSPDKIFEKAIITQQDLKQDYYGGNSFDIGEIDASIGGMISKIPIAIASGLFRPFPWEVTNVVMAFSAMEGAILAILTIWLLMKVNFFRLIRHIFDDPMLIFCLSFSLFFAFSIGLTTANFGALVRFKIPCLPYFVVFVFVLLNMRKQLARSSD